MIGNLFLKPFLSNWPMLALLAAIWIAMCILRSPAIKGRLGESKVNRGLGGLDPALYHLFHDLYLPRPDGKGSTQVDHIVVSPFGIFVIETKNYQGWIYGGEKQRQWTQQIYRRKQRFQNPLHQNLLHVRALMNFLQLPESTFHSVIFFIGNAEFKTPMPANVLSHGLRSWVENHRDCRLDPEKVAQISKKLAAHELTTDRKIAARQHLKDLKSRRAA